jgi:uncharacterized membrane protein
MVVEMVMEAESFALSLAYAMHMLATVFWIGGLLYQSFFLLPAIRTMREPEFTRTLLERLRNRFQPVAWLSLAVLVGTGLIQMAANPNYDGFLAIENNWAKAILLKHLAMGLMILLAAYQSFILYPRLTRTLLRQTISKDNHIDTHGAGTEHILFRVNVLLSIVVLLLTAIARAA